MGKTKFIKLTNNDRFRDTEFIWINIDKICEYYDYRVITDEGIVVKETGEEIEKLIQKVIGDD